MADVDIFEDALLSVFDHHQPAHGDPGAAAVFESDALPPWCSVDGVRGIPYRVPPQSSANTHLFAHYQWDAGVYLAEMLAERSLAADGSPADVRGKRVVELGAGTALPALVAAAMGARVVRRCLHDGRDGLP